MNPYVSERDIRLGSSPAGPRGRRSDWQRGFLSDGREAVNPPS